MSHPNAKLDALIARIRAEVEIRRTKTGKATVETAKLREKREARERGDDPALRALMRASNNIVFQAKPDPYKHFHEVGRTTILQRQTCRCCGGSQINVVAEMLHIRGRRESDTPIVDVWTRRSSTQILPHEEPIWAQPYSVGFCATCVETAQVSDCWFHAKMLPDNNEQLPLIN